ncbi:M15 family metallopeptidase [Ruicaihuangia caeni]|uniref:M15 family metallopeptidase n=1 Tax=Ruicaihuangia caeni TaxID=3042517 RepID=UPI00338E4A87
MSDQQTTPSGGERSQRAQRAPSPAVRRRRAVVLGIVAGIALVAVVWAIVAAATGAGDQPPASAPSKSPSPTLDPPPQAATPTPSAPPAQPEFDKTAQSIDAASSYWVVANKLRPLQPLDYAPDDLVEVPVPHVYTPQLRKAAADAVVEMFAAFTAETGLQLQSQSAYRSYTTQVDVYNSWVSSLGQAGADRTSARPGHSEHQTGLSIDISSLPAECALQACFGDTPHGKWLAANAWRFGFTLRYPNGMTPVTGYEYEPWHFRYVGPELAAELHRTGIPTLEEFFGLPPAPDYAG